MLFMRICNDARKPRNDEGEGGYLLPAHMEIAKTHEHRRMNTTTAIVAGTNLTEAWIYRRGDEC